jgi:5-methylcytosine-specific restriction protein A
MPDHRSPEAQAYRHLYRSSAWRKGRLIFLAQHPLCERCKAKGRITAATVVNHIKPHKGDITLFFAWSNWQSLCKSCHDGPTQKFERRGYNDDIGEDGWPTDNRHPANR